MTVGIEALNVYCGVAQIPVHSLFAGRGLDPARLRNLMMHNKSVGLPCEDPVTNAVNAAKPLLDQLSAVEKDSIELLVTSTESGIDYSKSVASYVHEYLGLSRRCRVLEAKQACYAATGSLQLAAGYLASGVSPGAKALVIGTDVSLVDERAAYTEPAMGAGAAAMLISAEPHVLALDLGAFGLCSYETLDSARPGPTMDIADSDRSLFAYIDCLRASFNDYADRVDQVEFATSFDYLCMHTPFAGIVRAAHRTMMRPLPADEDFERRLAPALVYPGQVGNLCSGSVYLGLASLVDNAGFQGNARVGLYSYGSGCAAEFFSGVVGDTSRSTVAAMRIGDHLSARFELAFTEYVDLLADSSQCLVPTRNRASGLDRCLPMLRRYGLAREVLVFTGIKDYHRQYEWITAG
ncbi:MAG: hydroxymethylglutaryl-CoA synthase [Umezawaea sp.]